MFKKPSRSKAQQLIKKFYQIGGNSSYPKIFEGDPTLIASQKKCGNQNGSGCPVPLYVKKNNQPWSSSYKLKGDQEGGRCTRWKRLLNEQTGGQKQLGTRPELMKRLLNEQTGGQKQLGTRPELMKRLLNEQTGGQKQLGTRPELMKRLLNEQTGGQKQLGTRPELMKRLLNEQTGGQKQLGTRPELMKRLLNEQTGGQKQLGTRPELMKRLLNEQTGGEAPYPNALTGNDIDNVGKSILRGEKSNTPYTVKYTVGGAGIDQNCSVNEDCDGELICIPDNNNVMKCRAPNNDNYNDQNGGQKQFAQNSHILNISKNTKRGGAAPFQKSFDEQPHGGNLKTAKEKYMSKTQATKLLTKYFLQNAGNAPFPKSFDEQPHGGSLGKKRHMSKSQATKLLTKYFLQNAGNAPFPKSFDEQPHGGSLGKKRHMSKSQATKLLTKYFL